MTRTWATYFFVALLIKGALFGWFQTGYRNENPPYKVIGGISFLLGDTIDYYVPTENLIDHGIYGRSVEPIGWMWATRMPGFLPIYGPLYYFFGRTAGHIGVILLQVVTDAMAVVVLAATAQILFNSEIACISAFILYSISAFVSTSSNTFRSETFCASFVVFAVYFFVRALYERKTRFWLWSGFFIAWATFMRPATGALASGMLFVYFLHNAWTRMDSWAEMIKNNVIFCTALFVAMSVWTIRNYRALHRFVPFTTTMQEYFFDQPQHEAILALIPAWGGEQNTWGKKSYRRWFLPPDDPNFSQELADSNPFSNRIFTPDYDFESIIALRTLYWNSYDTKLDKVIREANKVACVEKAHFYLASFKKYHPFYHLVTANALLLSKFLFVTQTFTVPFTQPTIRDKLIRAFYFFLYWFVLLGWMGGILCAVLKRHLLGILLNSLLVIHIVVHAVALGWILNWYLVAIYPLMVLYVSYAVECVIKWFGWPPKVVRETALSS